MRDEGVAIVGTGPDDLLLEAAEACPAVAIAIVDGETGKAISMMSTPWLSRL